MDFKKLYDLTPKEKAILDWKQARREQLRAEYLDSQYNPIDRKPFLDTGIQRWVAQGALKDRYFSGNVWTAAISLAAIVGTMGSITYFILNHKSKREQQIRSGKISYKDREDKFK